MRRGRNRVEYCETGQKKQKKEIEAKRRIKGKKKVERNNEQ